MRHGLPFFTMDMSDVYFAMYVVDYSVAGSLCVPRLQSIAVSSVGSSAVACPCASIADEQLSFTLDSGTSQCFFRDHITISLLHAPIAVSFAGPSSRPVVARIATTLTCLADPSGSLTYLHIPSFSRNLLGVGRLLGHERFVTYTDATTKEPLATFPPELARGPYPAYATPAAAAPTVKAQPRTRSCRAAPLSRAAPPPPNRTALLSSSTLHCPATIASTAATGPTAAMASPTILTFDAEGRAVDFDWTTRDVVARLAVRSHLPPAERAHFGQYKTANSLYDAVVARYSSPATAALSRLMLPYLFPDLAAFATVADLVAHLRLS
ncbi:unnamed protein product [Closterium sp. NIES-54]